MTEAVGLWINGCVALILALIMWRWTHSYWGWLALFVPGSALILWGWWVAIRARWGRY